VIDPRRSPAAAPATRAHHRRWSPGGGTLALLAAVVAAVAPPARAEDSRPGLFDRFKDSQDGGFDVSDWLLESHGFLPVPVVVTEPAVGYGGGLFLLFFNRPDGGSAGGDAAVPDAATAPGGRARTPPDIYAIGGAATENGTWAGAAGGMATLADDRFRWRGGVARMSVNLDFYGPGGRYGPIGYTLDGWASIQQGMMRLGHSDAWISARWNYIDLDNRFDFTGDTAGVPPFNKSARASGLGLSLEYDSRDNIFTPSRGAVADVEGVFYDPSLGSDTRFQTWRAHAWGWWPIGRSLVLAGRIDGRSASGDVPFYMLPFVDLRGVPLARLQDEHVAVVETELRWNLTPRWAVVGFAGDGRVWGFERSFQEGTGTLSGGVGFRYLIARKLGLYVGLDYARSSVDQAVYIQVGNAWR
jgi:hypothetical protein